MYMSPRNYFFQSDHPEVAKEYHEELSTFIPNIYYGIVKFFSFTAKWKKDK